MRPALAWWILLVPLVLSGCQGFNAVDADAKQQIAQQRQPPPKMILVQDFAVAPDEVEGARPWSGPRLVDDSDRTAGERAIGHAFAGEFASALVDEIKKLGLPAERGATSDLPLSEILTVKGHFISLAGDPSAPGVVGFSGAKPDVIADVQLYATNSGGDQLSEELEVSLSQDSAAVPAALLPDPTITAGAVTTVPTLSPEQREELRTAARQGAATVARQLETYFAGKGWIPQPQG